MRVCRRFPKGTFRAVILPTFLMLPLALSIPSEPPCPRESSWWTEVRMAPPGAVFLRSGVAFVSGQSEGRLEGRWISGGTGEVHGAIALPLDADRTLALGLSGGRTEWALRFSWQEPEGSRWEPGRRKTGIAGFSVDFRPGTGRRGRVGRRYIGRAERKAVLPPPNQPKDDHGHHFRHQEWTLHPPPGGIVPGH